MSPLPWPLIGRTHHATGGTVTPAPPPPRPAAVRTPVLPPTGEPHDRSGTRYPDLTDPHAWPGQPLWLIAESAVLATLATAGGDLPAHQAVHQETR